MAIQQRGKAVHAANLGLYFDRPPLLVPERGLSAGDNFRIQNGQATNQNVGWSDFEVNLDDKPVILIDEFQPQGGTRKSIFANTTDLFQYFNETLTYITPRHDATGETIDVTLNDDEVTGNGTAWETDGIKAGDFICIGANEDDPAATWYEIESVDSETALTLTGNYLGATAATQAYTIRRTFTSSIFEPFFSAPFPNADDVSGTDGDRWYATNGVDPIVAWDGTATQVYYSHAGVDTCKYLTRYKNTLVLVAPTVGGTLESQSIITSAIGQPENISTLEAAEFVVHDGADPLIAAKQIGELLAIYAGSAIYLAQFVGAPIMYVFRTAVADYGARSARGIVSFPGYHLVFSNDCQRRFDGVSAEPVNQHVWKDITRRSSPNRPELVQGVIDEGNAEVIWVVPLNSDADADEGPPERAYVGAYLEDVGENPMAHSVRQLPATAIGTYVSSSVLTFDELTLGFDTYSIRWDDQQLQSAFPQILFGDNNGDIWQLNAQNQDETVPTSFVRFSRRPLVDSRHNGVIKRVYPNVDFQAGSTGLATVNLRLFDSPNGTTAKQEVEETISLDGTERFAAFRNSARFVEVEFGTGPSTPGVWSLEGYDMDVAPGGER
jgi:hypothetical protein